MTKKKVITKSKKEVKTKSKKKEEVRKSGPKKAAKKDIGKEINKLKEKIGNPKPEGRKKGKTELILKMAGEGCSRKEIIDKLQSISSLTRKSTAGLVSHVLGRYNLRNIPAGIEKELERRKEKKNNLTKQKESEINNPERREEQEVVQTESIIIT